jgi:hypothetical protein
MLGPLPPDVLHDGFDWFSPITSEELVRLATERDREELIKYVAAVYERELAKISSPLKRQLEANKIATRAVERMLGHTRD